MLFLYDVGRYIAARHVGMAFHHAGTVLGIERWLYLPDEAALQHWFLDAYSGIVQVANVYYASMHFPMTILTLVWLFFSHPLHYLWARRALVTATGLGLVIEFVYPLAPPRMLDAEGFIDAAEKFGQSVYDAPGVAGLSNQFAAMPSLHVGWALLVAIVLISSIESRWSWLFALHPIVTLFVVVITANHYWLDGLVGSALVVFALAIHRRDSLMPYLPRAVVPPPRRAGAGEPATR
jgi:PAP2 superfamily